MNEKNSTPPENGKKPFRLVIVGGVAGGASTAARARRLDETAEIVLIERGPDISFANCGLPYHIGGEIGDRSKLAVQTPESLRAQLAIDVRVNTEAVAINREAKTLRIRERGNDAEAELPYDKLVLSPGAAPLRPPIDGIDLPGIETLRDLRDMDRIKSAVAPAGSVLIVGAGFIGLEMAEQLVQLGKNVTLVEQEKQVLPPMDPEMTRAVEQELLDKGVNLVLGDGLKGFSQGSERALAAELKSGRRLGADHVLLSIGVRPENTLAKNAGLELGARGHIVTDAYMRTEDPDIYAVGDASETTDPILGGRTAVALGGPANRQGRVAADHSLLGDRARPYPGSIGTAIVRVFDIAAGVTGHGAKRLRQLGVEFGETVISGFNHAAYFPGAVQITVKLLWEKASGRILGGQVTGPDGVDKRIDVIATAIKGNLTVEDVEHLELAYAPPFGAAKDPVNIAGFSANNIRDRHVRPIYELPDPETTQLIDVRPAETVRLAPIPGARNIPFPELRGRLNELDTDRSVSTVCAFGKMSYFAARILKQEGFDVSAHVGGWKVSAPTRQSGSNGSGVSPAGKNDPGVPAPETEVVRLDATGIACPGPIVRVREAAGQLKPGQILEVTASDPGFKNDLPAFCKANGYECIGVEKEKGIVTGRIRQLRETEAPEAASQSPAPVRNGATLVVFSGELDKAMAALVIANGAVAMGGKATLFFTYWGLNVLRKNPGPHIPGKSLMDKAFGWMLPRGPEKLPLSRMHMFGLGTGMMKRRMAEKSLPNLPGLLEDARKSGIRLVACTMTMEAMGIREEELIDGIELGGVAEYLGAASETNVNPFI